MNLMELEKGEGKKHMVISYKQMHVNIYSLIVIELATSKIVFIHDQTQTWERPIFGLLNTHNNDFITLNKNGSSFCPLGNVDIREVANSGGTQRMIHPLIDCNYLKIEP